MIQEQVLTETARANADVEIARTRDARNQILAALANHQPSWRPESVFETLRIPPGSPEPKEVTWYEFSAESQAKLLIDHIPRKMDYGPDATGFWTAMAHRCAVLNCTEEAWRALELGLFRIHFRKRLGRREAAVFPPAGYPPYPSRQIGHLDGKQIGQEMDVISGQPGMSSTSRYDRRAFAHLAHVYLASKGYKTDARSDILKRVTWPGSKETVAAAATFRLEGEIEEPNAWLSFRALAPYRYST